MFLHEIIDYYLINIKNPYTKPKQKPNSTSSEISQLSKVAFYKLMLYQRDLRDKKYLRHKTYMDDLHLIEDVLHVIHFLNTTRSSTERFKQIIFFYTFKEFFFDSLVSLINNNV